jgi:hypothetical protein
MPHLVPPPSFLCLRLLDPDETDVVDAGVVLFEFPALTPPNPPTCSFAGLETQAKADSLYTSSLRMCADFALHLCYALDLSTHTRTHAHTHTRTHKRTRVHTHTKACTGHALSYAFPFQFPSHDTSAFSPFLGHRLTHVIQAQRQHHHIGSPPSFDITRHTSPCLLHPPFLFLAQVLKNL